MFSVYQYCFKTNLNGFFMQKSCLLVDAVWRLTRINVPYEDIICMSAVLSEDLVAVFVLKNFVGKRISKFILSNSIILNYWNGKNCNVLRCVGGGVWDQCILFFFIPILHPNVGRFLSNSGNKGKGHIKTKNNNNNSIMCKGHIAYCCVFSLLFIKMPYLVLPFRYFPTLKPNHFSSFFNLGSNLCILNTY